MKKYLPIRIILAGTFFVSIFFASWWVPPVIGLFLLMFFNAWEVVFGALIIDLLYTSSYSLFSFPALWTASSLLAFFAFRILRSKLF